MSYRNKSMPSVTRRQTRFAEIPDVKVPRSTFDRSHGYKTTFDSGYLVPIFIDEALPGDTFSLGMSHFARMSTPLVPLMDNIFFDVFFFAVPNRLVWDNWQKFCGEQIDPGDSTDYLMPGLSSPGAGFAVGTIFDYMGMPTGVDFDNGDPTRAPTSLPLRAYNLIYNEWFRDQNLIDSLTVEKGDGPDAHTLYTLQKRGKRKDYFTSALPWPQKGDAVLLPLGDQAPITGIGFTSAFAPGTVDVNVIETGGTAATYDNWGQITSGTDMYINSTAAPGAEPLVYADLAEATAATINQIRQAFQVQRMFERDARGGTRYIEIIRSHFGVSSPDARLQRPEYLGGYSSRININPVAQTSSTDATTPQGNLAAVGTSADSKGVFNKSFTEHSYVIGIASVRADLTYQQGLDRMWSRRTRFDFYWPALAHLGEQAVLNREIYAQGNATDLDVFGYQERYAEYRYKPSKITGQFRSSAATSLDMWHLSQDFSSLPGLNETFINEDPPFPRVLAVADYPEFLLDAWFNFKCTRPMPVYGQPGLVDHF